MRQFLVVSFVVAGLAFVGVAIYGYTHDLTMPGLWIIPALVCFGAASEVGEE